MNPTALLARFAQTDTDALPEWVLHEAKRTLINILGVALSASRDPSAQALERWTRLEACAPRAAIVGSGTRTSPTLAALVNGYLAHLHDYDDTHFPTVLHPSAPVWPAVLAAAEVSGCSGREALAAFALGAEAACRVAMSVHPWHYDRGWHITGTAGVFGAAVGAGRALGLDESQLVHALGLAGTHAAGVRETFGSSAKAMHAAQAASVGVRSATLAAEGLTGPDDIISGRRGFWAVLSPDGHSQAALAEGLGQRWELRNNGLKPYANGVVSHPIQDAVIALRSAHAIAPEHVAAIEARVHPLVLELMDRAQPRTGLEGKFSFQHCAAAALVDGAGHSAQFTDARVRDPLIARLRDRVTASVDATLEEDATRVAIVLESGARLETHIEHATGSPANPMTDAALEQKYIALACEVLPADRARRLLDTAWTLDAANAVEGLLALTAPT